MSTLLARCRSLLRRGLLRLRAVGVPVPLRLLLRSPSEAFDAKWYLEMYPDVAAAGHDPLQHFLLHGHLDGRLPNRRSWCERELAAEAFDESWYLRRYPDVGQCGIDPLFHYLTHGRQEGRSPTINHARAAAWVRSFGEQ